MAAWCPRTKPHRHSTSERISCWSTKRYQVQTKGWARDVATGSRVFASGRLEIIADYEFDGFQLTESRTNWLVNNIEPLGNGDLMIDLAPSEG